MYTMSMLEVAEHGLHELMLFAACAFVIGGAADLLIDLLWLTRTLWRSLTVYTRFPRTTVASLRSPTTEGTIAVFIPAWDEADVLAAMLENTTRSWGEGNWTAFVGLYINDPATRSAAGEVHSPNILKVVGDKKGPTTKAENLNRLWRAMLAEERTIGARYKAVVIHDAEDVVHPDEIRVYDSLIERFDLVQLPVLPLIDRTSRWIGGHYLDEFAESHGKTLIVREAIGAAVPAAGVGCAFSRDMLQRIADQQNNLPFDQASLTEDYEVGLRIKALGGKTAFVRIADKPGGSLVAVRAHFPGTFDAAVRQKARWIVGIALAGWDRLGWEGGLVERWMRVQDRASPLAALVLVIAYSVLTLNVVLAGLHLIPGVDPATPASSTLKVMLLVCLGLLIWRLLVRAFFVTRAYGLTEGAMSIPRALVGNAIGVWAVRRAIGRYLRMRRDGQVDWDKTAHRFPEAQSTK